MATNSAHPASPMPQRLSQARPLLRRFAARAERRDGVVDVGVEDKSSLTLGRSRPRRGRVPAPSTPPATAGGTSMAIALLSLSVIRLPCCVEAGRSARLGLGGSMGAHHLSVK